MNLAFAALLQTTILGAQPLPYADAIKQSESDNKPLVVLVGAEWCGPCQTLKNTTMPVVHKDGVMQEVSFTVLDADRDSELAKQVTDGGAIPQLVMFHKTAEGWQRQKLVGVQSPSAIISFLRRGVQAAGRLVKPGDR
jgi:thioredoxin-like negative regulator of GroEL